jgi:hypothetical protein
MAKNLQTTRREFASTIIRKLYRLFILTFRYFGTLKFLVFKLSDYLSLFIDKQEEWYANRSPKSAALAAQNFMISMAAVNYDTCPMEALILSVKKNIKFTSCRWNQHDYRLIRDESGVYGERFRIPFEEVYFNYKTTLLF